MTQNTQQLRERLAQIEDLHAASALLEWDQQTKMPPRGAGKLPVIRCLPKCDIDCRTCSCTESSDVEADGYVMKDRGEPAERSPGFCRLSGAETCGLVHTLLLDLREASVWRAGAVLAPELRS